MREVFIFFLITIIAGPVVAFQYPFEYAYEYESSISTGITDLEGQVSAFAIKGLLTTQMQKDGTGIVKIQDPQRSEFHGKFDPTQEDEFPGQFQVSSEEKQRRIGVPFLAHLFDYALVPSKKPEAVLEIQKEGSLASANLKRSLMIPFRSNVLLKSNFKATAFQNIHVFGLSIHGYLKLRTFLEVEETLFGICMVEYSLQELPEDLYLTEDYKSKEQIKVDEQRFGERVDSSNILSDKLYRVIRIVQFDQCKYDKKGVYYQRTPIGVSGPLNENQFDLLRGRSSVTECIMRGKLPGDLMKGELGNMRVESCDVTGTITMDSHSGEMIYTRTRMKMKLVSVKKTKTPFELPSERKLIKDWFQDIETPIHVTPKTLDSAPVEGSYSAKSFVMEVIQHYSKVMVHPELDGNPDTILQKVDFALNSIKELDEEDLQEIFDHFMNKKGKNKQDMMGQNLVFDFFITVGKPSSTKILLKYLQSDGALTIRKMFFFMTAFQNLESPQMLPELMDFILEKLDKKEEIMTYSTALVNLAHAFEHFCTNPEAHNFHYKSKDGEDLKCKTLVLKKFLPYLKTTLEDGDLNAKMTAVFALRELKSPFSFSILIPVINGKHGTDLTLRVSAVRALRRWYLPPVVRKEVMQILKLVYSDFSFPSLIRQEALSAFATWGPSAPFWYALARSTWTEPSKGVAKYSVELLKAYVGLDNGIFLNQSKAASHAIKFARSFPPTTKNPTFFILDDYEDYRSSKTIEFDSKIIFDSQSALNIFGYIGVSHNGFKFSLLKILLQRDFNGRIAHLYMELQNNNSTKVENFLKEFKETLKIRDYDPNTSYTTSWFLEFFENIRLYLPKINYRELNYYRDFELGDDDRSTPTNKYLVGKFLNPIEGHLILPTDAGISVHSHVSFMISLCGQYGDEYSRVQSKNTFKIKLQSRVSSTMTAKSEDLGLRIGSSTRSIRQLNLPLFFERNYEDRSNGFTFERENEFWPLVAQNTPVTFVGPIFGKNGAKIQNYEEKIITPFQPKPRTFTFSPLGIKTEITWESQLESPIQFPLQFNIHNFPHIFEALSSNTARYWKFEANVNLRESETQKFQILNSHFFPRLYSYSSNDMNHEPSPKFKIADFWEEVKLKDLFIKMEFNLSREDTINEFKNYTGQIDEIIMRQLRLIGKNEDTLIGFKKMVYGIKDNWYKSLYVISKDSSTSSVKLCVDISHPPLKKISPLLTVEEVLSLDFENEVSLEVRQDCSGDPILSIKKTSKLSEMAKGVLKENLSKSYKSSGDSSSNRLLYILFSNIFESSEFFGQKSPFVFSDVNFDVNWKSITDPSKYPIASKLIKGLSLISGSELSCADDHDSSGHFSVQLNRCPHAGDWNIKLNNHLATIQVTDPNLNYNLDLLNNVGNKNLFIVDHESPWVTEKCSISQNQVGRFDGNGMEVELSSCWTVAFTSYVAYNSDYISWSFMILVRKSSSGSNVPELRLVSKPGVMIDMADGKVLLNGEEFELTEGEKIIYSDTTYNSFPYPQLYFNKKGDYFQVEIPGRLRIIVTDKVIILPLFRYKFMMYGLCGNDNGEMVGPERCFWADPKAFTAAWSAGSDMCDSDTLVTLRKDAEDYQKSCKTIEEIRNKTQTVELFSNGHDYGYLIFLKEKCVSQVPWPVCEGMTKASSHTKIEVEFNCYKDVDEKILKSMSKYLNTLDFRFTLVPLTEEPSSTKTKTLEIPNACQKRV